MMATHTINSKKTYHKTITTVYNLLNKGETNLSLSEFKKLQSMATVAERYKDEVLNLKPKNLKLVRK